MRYFQQNHNLKEDPVALRFGKLSRRKYINSWRLTKITIHNQKMTFCVWKNQPRQLLKK